MKSRRATPWSRRAGSRGVTLIELMIAVTIGLLLVVVLAQLFLGSRQTFATTDDVSRMQDNIRFSQILLTRTIHQAGYKSQANSITTNIFKDPNFALAAVNSDPSLPLTPDKSDELTIRYQGSGNGAAAADGTIVDCLGVGVDAGVMVRNTFRIDVGENGRNALFCWNGVGPNKGLEIVPNVVNMQVLFGEDMNGDLVADRYVTPNLVTPPAGSPDQYLNVVSVRISLLFETPTESSRATADEQVQDLFGTQLKFTDRRIRRVVQTTINLRNRTP